MTSTATDSLSSAVAIADLDADLALEQQPTCEQCKTTTPWKGSSWCPECGYYPGITDALPESERYVPDPAENVPAVVERKPLMPAWLVQSIAIPTLIIVASIATRVYYTYYGGDRGVVSLFMFLTGLVAAIGAHVRTSLASINEAAELSPLAMLTEPIEMWRPTIRGLPATGGRIVSGVSGVTAVMCALVVIGGLDFGSLIKHDKKPKEDKKGIIARINDRLNGKGKEDSKTEGGQQGDTVVDPNSDVDPIADAAGLSEMPTPDAPLQCVVYGIMNDGGEGFDRVLLAAKVNGMKMHVGSLSSDDMPLALRKRISASVAELVAVSPVVKSSYRATWLRPRISLPIKFEGWTLTGEFVNPQLYSKKKAN